MIEKKVASRYQPEDPGDNDQSDTSDNDQSPEDRAEQQADSETQPLLDGVKEDDSAFMLSDEQPMIVRVIPVLPCLSNPSLLIALLIALVQATLIGSVDATVTTVSQQLFGFDSLKAGLLFLPIGLCDLICGPIAGWAVDRYGTKPVSVVTFIALIPIFVSLRIPHAGGMDQVVLYGALLGLVGIGLSGTGAPSIVEAGAVVDRFHKVNPKFFGDSGPYASLYGMNSMMFNAGLTVGPELAGELKEAIGYGNMNLVLAALCAVTAVLCFAYLGGKPKILHRSKS